MNTIISIRRTILCNVAQTSTVNGSRASFILLTYDFISYLDKHSYSIVRSASGRPAGVEPFPAIYA
eukprot:scaffold357792_cov26-Prasinocladus_malaysianus.AAC.1